MKVLHDALGVNVGEFFFLNQYLINDLGIPRPSDSLAKAGKNCSPKCSALEATGGGGQEETVWDSCNLRILPHSTVNNAQLHSLCRKVANV